MTKVCWPYSYYQFCFLQYRHIVTYVFLKKQQLQETTQPSRSLEFNVNRISVSPEPPVVIIQVQFWSFVTLLVARICSHSPVLWTGRRSFNGGSGLFTGFHQHTLLSEDHSSRVEPWVPCALVIASTPVLALGLYLYWLNNPKNHFSAYGVGGAGVCRTE